MVLAGIGGRTIKELEQNLTLEEFNTWLLYREKFGNLNPTLKNDFNHARLASIMSGAKFKDLAPHLFFEADENEDIKELTEEEKKEKIEKQIKKVLVATQEIKVGEKFIGAKKRKELKKQKFNIID